MWLQTKREIQNLKDGWTLSSFESNINSLVWGNIVVEIDEDSFSNYDETYVHLFEKGVKTFFIGTLDNAFNKIAIDDLWKSAIIDKIQKIVLAYDADNHYSPWIDLSGWVLTITHDYVSNIDRDSSVKSANDDVEQYLLSQL